jgi:rhodanese-related sulfurtransferase
VAVPRFTVNDLLAEARRGLRRLDPTSAQQAQCDGALLVDVRAHTDRWREGVIGGSLHVPLIVLPWAFDPASGAANPRLTDLDRPVVLFCNEGYSSSLAAATLQRIGFARATDLDGGFRAWKASGLPVQVARPRAEDVLEGRGEPEPVDPA